MARKLNTASPDLFVEGNGQLRLLDKSVEQKAVEAKRVECLGETFGSEDERRTYFTELLRIKLADPEFRKLPGFPIATDEDIIRMSDPPWHTACPNPFLERFTRVFGTRYNPAQAYERDPFAVDTSVGKSDALYKAHNYHTKVPHLAIVPSILHYTKPGDIVLDGFSGSGMTGIAAKWCGVAPAVYKKQIEKDCLAQGHEAPLWGDRHVILNDLSPIAAFMSSIHSQRFDADRFEKAASSLLKDSLKTLGWMYETLHTDGKTKGRIQYTVWSDVFSCPHCSQSITYLTEAMDPATSEMKKSFHCPNCDKELTRRSLVRVMETRYDRAIKRSYTTAKKVPVLIRYSVNGKAFEKTPGQDDLNLIDACDKQPATEWYPTDRMMHSADGVERWGDEWRAGVASFSHIHHAYLPRPLKALAYIWNKAESNEDTQTKRQMKYLVEQAIWGMSLMARYAPTHFSQVNQYMSGRIRTFSLHAECSPWYILEGKTKRLVSTFRGFGNKSRSAIVATGSCGSLGAGDESIDYIFTDPPFGSNFAYAELNFVTEAWHRVFTDLRPEAIVSDYQRKTVHEYQDLMRACFQEYARVLKPGRWMTVVFSNSSNAVWRAIQESMGTSGFVIADVRTLDKKQGSFNQVHGIGVNQDLIISAYKPTKSLTERFSLGSSSVEGAWAFVDEHLKHVPIFLGSRETADVVAERTAQVLNDRMVAFHVQRHLPVPMDASQFRAGLEQRYLERDGMYFLPNQAAQYEQKRMSASALRQLELFVVDEASAIQWLRRELGIRPRSLQDLTSAFLKDVQNWSKHEHPIELRDLLRQNFLLYEGNEPVPSQIHGYLSSNHKDCRGLKKDDPTLVEKAKDRWYVPDPKRQGDIDKSRARALLNEFETYKASKERTLKIFRTEAVRAGFAECYEKQDYRSIVAVAAKLPENIVQEDQDLLMYFDVASTRLET